MSAPLRLVIFDVDGTLVDSQADIIAAMGAAYAAAGLTAPTRDRILSGVGLSLEQFFAMLEPDQSTATHLHMAEAYKRAYMDLRAKVGAAQSSPLYPGAMAAIEALHAVPEVLLGIATGKSKRGLDKLIEGHALHPYFVTRQVADFHPSKPHPSMVLTAMEEAGVGPENTVMIGDTGFDMEMAAAAGVRGIGVTWGYHPRKRLHAAQVLIDRFEDLQPALDTMWSNAT